ncbi:MAG TPA: hypothetical protein VKY32_09570 [Flavobacterium sp.]|nr:hypothetical protein [Flavobacterium sp.]
MKLQILFPMLLLSLSIKTNAQHKDTQLMVDSYIDLIYDTHQIIPNKEDLKVLDGVAKLILEKKIPTNFYYYWQVEYLTCEKERDTLIEYKRLDYILRYLEENYDIKREIFKAEFYETEYCTASSTGFVIVKP